MINAQQPRDFVRSGRWSLLELMPRRSTRPSAGYFREGHRSLDRFVADLRGAPE